MPATPPAPEPAPLDEFCGLTMLLALVAAINSEGRQVIQPNSLDSVVTALEHSQPTHRLTSNTSATLLVCESEVVAVTTPGLTASSSAEVAGSLTLFAVQEALKPDNSTILEANFKLNFAAVPNPIALLHPFAGKDDKDQYTICKEGTSSWSNIEQDPWCKVALRWVLITPQLDVFSIPSFQPQRRIAHGPHFYLTGWFQEVS